MGDCIFCKIVDNEIPAQIVWEDENAIAFRDIQPQAPVHILFIPRVHVRTFGELADAGTEFLASLAKGVKEIAALEGVDESGYRLLVNNGEDAGQEVLHVHVHLFGGRRLGPMLKRQ